MFMSVDLPEPELPMIATSSPCSTSRLTPRSACTETSPWSYVFVRFLTSINMGHLQEASEAVVAAARAFGLRSAGDADDDPLAFAEILRCDLGALAVGEADLHRHRRRLAAVELPDEALTVLDPARLRRTEAQRC